MAQWGTIEGMRAPKIDIPSIPPATAALLVPAAGLIIALATGCSSEVSSSSSSSPAPSSPAAEDSADAPERLTAKVQATGPFNTEYFTQGLEVDADGSLLVGTGQYGESAIYRVDPATMDVKQQAEMDADHFGEGITRVDDKIWQLSWKAGEAIQRDATTLEEVSRVNYPGEGWGICNLGDKLVMSDGTPELRLLDPASFDEQGRVTVTAQGQEVANINELECVDGQVYANVWMTNEIIRIDPTSGVVNAIIDTSEVVNNAAKDPDNVLNGIAHIPGTDKFYVTGKRWPDLYTVTFE